LQFSVDGEQLRSWEFNVWNYTQQELIAMVEHIFNDFQLLENYKIPTQIFRNYVQDIVKNYTYEHPYHNFRHAFDVLQTTYYLLTAGRMSCSLNPLEISGLLVPPLVHDVAHPGVNHNYHIPTMS